MQQKSVHIIFITISLVNVINSKNNFVSESREFVEDAKPVVMFNYILSVSWTVSCVSVSVSYLYHSIGNICAPLWSWENSVSGEVVAVGNVDTYSKKKGIYKILDTAVVVVA